MTDDWWAFESLRESYDNTIDRLMPFETGLWLRFVVVSILAGGAGGGSIVNLFSSAADAAASAGSTTGQGASSGLSSYVTAGASSIPPWAIIVGVVALLAVFLGLTVLSSMAMFAFVRMTREDVDSLRAAFSGTFWNGLRYIGFRFGALFVLLGLGAVPAVLFYALDLLTVGVIVMIPYVIVLVLGFSFVLTFTRDVIVVDVFEEGRSFLGSWSRFAGIVRRNLADALVYWVIRFVAGMAGSIVSMMAMVLVLLVLGIGLGIVGFLVHAAGVPGNVVAVVFVGLGLLVLMAAMAVITMPVAVFMRYYGNNVYDAALGRPVDAGEMEAGGDTGAAGDADAGTQD